MTSSAWRGTSVLAPSGEVTASASQVVREASCRVVPNPAWRWAHHADDVPAVHTYSVLAIDSDCVFAAEQGRSFTAEEGRTCALTVGGVRRVLRVTDVEIGHSFVGYGRYGPIWNRGDVEIHLGGDDLETGRHLAYEFSGRIVDEVAPPAVCSSVRDPFAAKAP